MNGYKNSATFHVKLDIDNDRAKREMWRERAKFYANKENGIQSLADEIKACYEADLSNMQLDLSWNNAVFGTLLGHVLAEIDWDGIAEKMILKLVG